MVKEFIGHLVIMNHSHLNTFTGSQGGTLPNLITNFDEDFGYTVNQVVNVTQSWDGYKCNSI
jgi:hypothetical protein